MNRNYQKFNKENNYRGGHYSGYGKKHYNDWSYDRYNQGKLPQFCVIVFFGYLVQNESKSNSSLEFVIA